MVDVIVDVGSNWDPTTPRESWREMLLAAKEAGMDFVKGQDWSPLSQVNRPDEWKQRAGPWTLTPDLLPWIVGTAAEMGIPFYCSVFTRRAVRQATRLWYPFVKFASSEAANDELLREHSGNGMPAMVSFGDISSTWREMLTIATLNAWGQVIPFVCVAEYPASQKAAYVALEEIAWYKSLGLTVGWSSHVAYEDGAIAVATEAVMKGVSYIEAHMRLESTSEECPDNGPWALYPWQVRELVEAVRGTDDGASS